MKRANLVGKDIFAEQKVLIKAYLKVVKVKDVCQEVNLSNTTISELKNGRKNLDTLKFRSFEALYLAAKKYFTADSK
ncbi:hypothetical protein [Enterococcus faecium]|uniref:hypothetical protein n=1 Tax=Enterococcus faecium TaxID=1352 RepID=UPI0002A1F110|nr:hypothetical protein [Enterococcus faecium]ELA79733.1 hypothetical protein OGW_05067 [Enterococcus faecium EnGen0004]RBS82033.1 hypothetical protein EA78_02622 [Enterococcus faecium]